MTKVSTIEITKEFTKSVKKTFSNTSIRAIAIAVLFVISGIGASVLISPAAAAPNTASPSAAAPVAAATPLTQAEANWEYPNGNAFNQDYSPQNQINSSDVQYLGVSWIYPLPSLPTSLLVDLSFYSPSVGTDSLIVNGTAITLTAFDTVIAFNLANGDVLWTFHSPLTPNATVGQGSGPVPIHNHDGSLSFTTATFGSGVSGPTFWFQGGDNRVYAIDAINGNEELSFSDYTGLSMVPGNNPASIYDTQGGSSVAISQQLGILVFGMNAGYTANSARGFFAGWNLNTNPPSMKWISYTTPPQPGSNVPLNPNFETQLIANMTAAATFYPGENGSTNGYTTRWEIAGGVLHNVNDDIVVNWKALSASQLNTSLYNDWGYVGQTQQCLVETGGSSTGSTGAGWGSPYIVGSGQTAGMLILDTNNRDPMAGACAAGPDLWSASTLALNMNTGQFIWGFQANAHDIWDYDCSWYQGLANETISGVNTQVVIKTCKNGYLYEINAVTGNLIWAWDPPSGMVTPGPSRCPACFMWNPLNESQMSFDFPSAITNCAPTFTIACAVGPQPGLLMYPTGIAGFEDEQAYDPATNQIYATSHIIPSYEGYVALNASTYYSGYGFDTLPCPTCGTINSNATTWDIDASTGQIVWHASVGSMQYAGYRGQTDVSGNLVFLTESSGDIYMLNAQTGKLVRDFYVGAPMDVGVSIGASVSGQEFILFPVGTCSFEAVSNCPGNSPGDIVALALQPPSASATTTTVTSTTTAAAATVTATTTVAGATSTITSSTGISSSITYGIAAVAVIFIIATGYLAMTRGKKPSA